MRDKREREREREKDTSVIKQACEGAGAKIEIAVYCSGSR
jgi:hypothetical protein